jgi:uncharacterized tellurite resistance protein B-like protein
MDAARIYQLMVLTAWADGHLHELEQRMAGHILLDAPELHGLQDRDGLAKSALDKLESLGIRAAVEEVSSGLTTAREQRLAIVCCARVLAADGRIAPEEFAVISQLRQKFSMTVTEVRAILVEATRPRPGARS